ncbi:lipoprotein releasing system, transmembrane protein, LolC/E family protein [Psychromonas sp. CNPT3]|uniref:lipoprotein-releasing ABC transporter permease subunit n=1 Tax=Psychromonas sp. CNPT3 TaxID=314282 RepID=UPI00006E2D39|nr:lipoprotein-releasing ABC transporter permease subunit [Psychromonas sp. CNPT3]AGH81287.1 lipoprotein releasing system, transmembrane protein, LolC/E family protein [Psychromonas sp. CNPT3]
MFYPLSLFIGLRYTKSKRNNAFVSFVSLFSTGGITLGVLALITVLSVMNGFESELKTRILGAVPHVSVSNNAQLLTKWEYLLPILENNPDVRAADPMVSSDAIILSNKNIQGVHVDGIYPQRYSSQVLMNSMLPGTLSRLEAGKYRILMGDRLGRLLSVDVGDKVRVVSARGSRFTPLGRLPSERKFTVAGFFSVGSDVDQNLILMHATDASKLIRIAKNNITDIRLYLNDPFDIESWTPPTLDASLALTDWRSTHGELFAAVKMEKNMIWLLLCLIIVVAAFNILSSSVMIVNDKKTEVAILKTLGLSRTKINFIFVIQGAWSGLWGALLGTGLGLLLSNYINEVLSFLGIHLVENAFGESRHLPVEHQSAQIWMILCGAMLLSLLATLYPAYRAGKVSPVEALRDE